MAKQKKNIELSEKEIEKKEMTEYPISTLFQVSMLAGIVAFFIFYFKNPNGDIFAMIFRAFFVFTIFAICGGVIIVLVVSIFNSNREREERVYFDEQYEKTIKNIEEAKQRFEEERKRLEEEARIASEGPAKT
jgi:uncharacterized membrane protein